jgi:predicted Zn-ribbon and HTH transcriptional regulator
MKFETIEQFTDMNLNVIDSAVAEIMRVKQGEQVLTVYDVMAVTAKVKNIYRVALQIVPPQIEAACGFAEAVVDPTTTGRIKTLKNVLSIAGGAAGLGLIITGIGGLLGWGAGAITAAIAFFSGTAIAGPVGLVTAGVGIAVIAGYFALSKNDTARSQKTIEVLKEGVRKAIVSVWAENEEKLKAFDYETK